MRNNRKLIAIGAAAAALTAVAGYAIADAGHGRGGHGMGMGMGPGMGHGMGMGPGGHRGAGMGMQDPIERLATIRSELAIKPEQTAAWDAYAKVVTDTASERRKVHEGIDRDAVHAMKPEERQAFRDAMMKQRDEAQAKIKSAADTLLAQLDETQKSKARQGLPGLAEGGFGHGMRHGMHGGPGSGMGRGMGPHGQR